MKRLPIIYEDTSFATALTITRGEMFLEPARIWNGEWHVRRDGRLVPAVAGEFDAFIMERGEVTDRYQTWTRLSRYLADRGLVVPGDREALGDLLRAAHWRRIAVPVERYRGRGSDTGLVKTLARGSAPRAGQQRRAA
ncbi:MAG: hypothetical protein DCC69_06600 [Hyphomicrobiales bacterium]|nr:MAG: hypothetical protein DCC69_06600 [Hyphomicrobiales bacterium]